MLNPITFHPNEGHLADCEHAYAVPSTMHPLHPLEPQGSRLTLHDDGLLLAAFHHLHSAQLHLTAFQDHPDQQQPPWKGLRLLHALQRILRGILAAIVSFSSASCCDEENVHDLI